MSSLLNRRLPLLLVVVTLLITTVVAQATIPTTSVNLIPSTTWTAGTGSASSFNRVGTDASNVRALGQNPHGVESTLWSAQPDGINKVNGGWDTAYFSVNNKKTYRYTVWAKKTGSQDGNTFFGLYTDGAKASNLNNPADGSLFFWSGDLLQLDKWYLLVGYVHGSDYTEKTLDGGIYDGTTGAKIMSVDREFKWSTTTNKAMHRISLNGSLTKADRQYFWDPRVEEVTGNEPSIENLINAVPAGSQIYHDTYFQGKVGIGTMTPTQALDVLGTVRADKFEKSDGTPIGGTSYTNLTEKDGNIGIGTSTPTNKLEVSGSAKLTAPTGEAISISPTGEICLGRCS